MAHTQLTIGLTLLGFGWSATTIAGAAMLTSAVQTHERASTQGLGDLTMGLAAVAAGLASGPIVTQYGYPTLCLIAGIITALALPLVLLNRKATPTQRSNRQAPKKEPSRRNRG